LTMARARATAAQAGSPRASPGDGAASAASPRCLWPPPTGGVYSTPAVSRAASSASAAPAVPPKGGGCATEKVVKSSAARRSAASGAKPTRLGLGEVFKVDRLLASKGVGDARHFIVRWQKPYHSAKDDSDERACDISRDLIDAFDSSSMPKAPWKDSGWYYLVERILAERKFGEHKQYKVRWSGYSKWNPMWVDEDKVVPSQQAPPSETSVAEVEAKRVADLEGCNLPCATALTRKRKRAPLPRATADWVKPEVSRGKAESERVKKRQQKSAVPKGAVMEVDRLLASRPIGKSARVAYLVRWKGFDAHEDCWEPAANIEDSLVADFEDSPLPKASLAGHRETWLIEKVLERKGDRSLVRWLGYGHRPNTWVDSQHVSISAPQSDSTASNCGTQNVRAPSKATDEHALAVSGVRCQWVTRAMELLVKPKVSTRMVAFQVERAAVKAGESIDQSGFDAVLEEQQALNVPEERILALQDALGL